MTKNMLVYHMNCWTWNQGDSLNNQQLCGKTTVWNPTKFSDVFWKKGYAPRIFLRKFITTKYLPTIVHRWCAKRLNTQDIPHLTGDVTQSHHMTCFILLMRNLFPSKPYMVLKHWRAYEDTTLAASPLDVRCLSLPWPLSLLPIQVASAVAKAAMRFRRASFKYKEHW